MRPLVVVTAFLAEAKPLIDKLELRPVRNGLLSKFQAYRNQNTIVVASGLGKLKAAAVTAATLAESDFGDRPIVANVGIAGGKADRDPPGSLYVINKITDESSGSRFYPDVLLRHPFEERYLRTYDRPVTTPPDHVCLVDMEGAAFFQAASTFVPPSQILVLKVVSDHCTGTRITPPQATALIQERCADILSVISVWRSDLTENESLTRADEELIVDIVEKGHFSETQAIELRRAFRHRIASDPHSRAALTLNVAKSPHTKRESKELFSQLLNLLVGDSSL